MPANRRVVVVLDLGEQVTPSQGTLTELPEHGRVLIVGSASSSEVSIIGADPTNRPEQAWRLLHQMETPSTGALFVASHKASDYVVVDSTLSAGRAGQNSTARPNRPFRFKSDGHRRADQALWNPSCCATAVRSIGKRGLADGVEPRGRNVRDGGAQPGQAGDNGSDRGSSPDDALRSFWAPHPVTVGRITAVVQ